MANYSCSSCEDLRSTSPNFVVNGITDTECTSLQNDTGLNPSSGHDDCTDLNNINDCLVGNMAEEVEAYDVCDWKTYMKKFVPNAWTTLKSMICAICGLWTRLEKLECQVAYMAEGATFSLGEVYSDRTVSHIVAGKGVSFLNVSSSGTSSDIALTYISGGIARLAGSCLFYTSSFTDGDYCYNFDNNGNGSHYSKSRSGNPAWSGTNQKPSDGSTGATELVYELRVKKSEYKQIERFFAGLGLNGDGAGYHAQVLRFAAGSYAYGQHGRCNTQTGAATLSGYDNGHLVPDGWEYLQMRISWIESMSGDASGVQYTPSTVLGIRIAAEKIDC